MKKLKTITNYWDKKALYWYVDKNREWEENGYNIEKVPMSNYMYNQLRKLYKLNMASQIYLKKKFKKKRKKRLLKEKRGFYD